MEGAEERCIEYAWQPEEQRDSFCGQLDIAHADAMKLINIEEDRKFPEAQREKGQRGCMGAVDTKLAKQEKTSSRDALEEKRKLREKHRVDASVPGLFWVQEVKAKTIAVVWQIHVHPRQLQNVYELPTQSM